MDDDEYWEDDTKSDWAFKTLKEVAMAHTKYSKVWEQSYDRDYGRSGMSHQEQLILVMSELENGLTLKQILSKHRHLQAPYDIMVADRRLKAAAIAKQEAQRRRAEEKAIKVQLERAEILSKLSDEEIAAIGYNKNGKKKLGKV